MAGTESRIVGALESQESDSPEQEAVQHMAQNDVETGVADMQSIICFSVTTQIV